MHTCMQVCRYGMGCAVLIRTMRGNKRTCHNTDEYRILQVHRQGAHTDRAKAQVQDKAPERGFREIS